MKNILEKDVETKLIDYNVRIFWEPDMCAFLEGRTADTKGAVHIADIDISGGIDWDKTGLQVLGCLDENAAKLKMLASQRRTR